MGMGLNLYWDAYDELASFANLSPTRLPILWADAEAYTRRHGFDLEQRETFMHVVAELEAIIMDHVKPKGGVGGKSKPTFTAHSRSKQKVAR